MDGKAAKPAYPGLELEEDIRFEKKNWIAERIAWVILLLVTLAALAGLLGRGGLSRQKAVSEPGGLEVKYERFLRYHTGDKLELKISRKTADSTYQLLIGKEFLEKVRIEQFAPQPVAEAVTQNGIAYTFKTAPQQFEFVLAVFIKPDGWGNMQTNLADSEGRSVRFSQFIYP
jgi:hypothetical protein